MDNDLFVGGRPAQRRREPEVRRRPTMRDEYLSDLSEGEEEVAVRIPEHMPRRPRTIELYNGNARAGLDRESHFGDRGSRFGDRESRYKDWENGTSYEDLDDVNPMRARYPRRRFVYVNRRRFRPMKVRRENYRWARGQDHLRNDESVFFSEPKNAIFRAFAGFFK